MRIFWDKSQACLLLWFLLALSFPARAEVLTLQMPQDYADYCIHPQTRDLAAVWGEKGEVHLYRAADLAAKKLEPYVKVRVGTTPCAVCCKRFGDLDLFAVVCTQDANMYLINAKDGTLYRQVGLEGQAFCSVFCSLNPQDPYVYYCCGRDHDSAMGAVNLREFKSYNVLDDVLEVAISATGRYVYRRGWGASRGLNALQLVGDFSNQQPKFSSLVALNQFAGEVYLPDPFEQYTASDEDLFTPTLDKRVAKLGIKPLCFFNTKPLIIGFNEEKHHERKGDVQLHAVSYNTFGKIGKPIVLKEAYDHGGRKDQFGSDTEALLPRGGNYNANYIGVSKRLRLFADDAGDRVVFAYRKRVDYVPLKDFELQPEPLLFAKLDQPGLATLNSEWKGEVKPFDPATTIEFGTLPEGMTATGKTLKWKPKPEQIGQHKIEVTLKHQELERTMTFEVTAGSSATTLPFTPIEFALNKDGSKILISNISYGHLAEINGKPTFDNGRLVLLETATGKVLAERKQTEPLRFGTLSQDYAILIRQDQSGCEVLKLSTLEREKSLSSTSDIVDVRVLGSLLVLVTERGGEIYELGTFKKVRTFETPPDTQIQNDFSPLVFFGEALAFGGTVYNADLKPQLVYTLAGLPTLQGGKPGWEPRPRRVPEFSEDRSGGRENQSFSIGEFSSNGTLVELVMRNLVVAGKQLFELSIKVHGEPAAQVLFRGPIFVEHPSQFTYPRLRVAENTAIIVMGQSLYRWTVPANAPAAAHGVDLELQFEPRQSALSLSGTGTTTLKHQASGGKSPLKYSVRSPYDGIKIDETTGTMTIDEKPLLAEAAQAIEKFASTENGRGATRSERLRASAPEMIATAERILGRRPAGIPVAIPLLVAVTDANLQESLLPYYVLAEIPSVPILERLKQLDANPEQAPRAVANNPAQAAPDIQALQQRIDALEQRLELNTRQLNQLLKMLEQK